jgi:putative transposase
MTCRPGRPFTTTSAAGGVKGCGNRSTPPSALRSGFAKAASPRRARPSWTARASRPPNGGRHGYDGAKKVNGRKRHLLVDTLGLIIKVHLTAADVGDRDDAMELLRSLDRRRFPRLRHGWADGGYRGPFLDWAHQRRGITFQVVQRHDGGRQRRWLPPGATPPIVSPFAVVPRRWVVERTFAWLGRYRRLSKDYEYLTATSEAVIYLAMTRLLLRRLTRP